jgi:hypothetical protein
VKPKINSVDVHPQLSDKGHPVDDGAQGGCCWFTVWPVGFDPAVLLRVVNGTAAKPESFQRKV